MKFSEFVYERPDLDLFVEDFRRNLDKLEGAESTESVVKTIKSINELRNQFLSMKVLATINYTRDTKNEEYSKEQDFFDENFPVYQEQEASFFRFLTNSSARKELSDVFGDQFFKLAELETRVFSPKIMEDLKTENKLVSEYTKLLASGKAVFNGEELPLPKLAPFMLSEDRDTRKSAYEARYSFFKDNEAEFDRLYDELVTVRTKIAKTLGYDNFVQLGYDRLDRSDYDGTDVKLFRDQIYERLIPLAVELKKRQAKRLGIDKLKYYDEGIKFLSGNPNPLGDAREIIAKARDMYRELSKETGEFFDFMADNGLMDLLSRDGKYPGGYCDFVFKYRAPFIFANFNGTSADVDVLTHEAGHAFQVYMSRGFDIPYYHFPTMEACEIHSTSMEYITWPWMELFYGEEAEKRRFIHMTESLLFVPYGVAVDEFQHYVYENPEATPAQRKSKWRKLEKKYLPDRDYEGNEYLLGGALWQQQGHIFEVPFYYIDYVLAFICALQFWRKFNDGEAGAWESYVRLCKAGGSKSFLGLLELAGLESPFAEGTVTGVVEPVERWLNSVDDSKF